MKAKSGYTFFSLDMIGLNLRKLKAWKTLANQFTRVSMKTKIVQTPIPLINSSSVTPLIPFFNIERTTASTVNPIIAKPEIPRNFVSGRISA